MDDNVCLCEICGQEMFHCDFSMCDLCWGELEEEFQEEELEYCRNCGEELDPSEGRDGGLCSLCLDEFEDEAVERDIEKDYDY